MRVRRLATVLGSVVAASSAAVLSTVHPAIAQQIEITPETSITPSSHATQWVVQMAIGAVVLGVFVVIAVGLGYLRFAPKFFGRDEAPRAAPGARPPQLARQAAAVRYAPPPAPARPTAARPAPATSAATATAVAERPAPPPATDEGAAAAAVATETPTAGPSAEPAAQADAVGQAEVAAPEASPPAKTTEDGGSQPAAAPAASSSSHGATMDQETFDRVLQEQLAKGVDKRVAEGRARAAAVVAARKKTQE